MPTPFVMPKMDMDQEVVTIIEWLKKEGEKVTKGEAVVSVETDKITSDIEAPETGTLVGILYHENEEAPVTQVVAYILKEGESLAELPMVNESSQGSVVQSDSDQALGDTTPSLRVTPVAERMASSMKIDLTKVQSKGEKITKTDIENYLATPQPAPLGKVAATPAARRISKENEIELASLSGSVPRGRIQSLDVVEAVTSATQISKSQGSSLASKNAPSIAESSIPLVGKRKRIAERLTASYQNSPHIYLTVEVDMSRVEESRKRMNKLNDKTGLSPISITAYLARLVAWTLKRHPLLNASLVEDRIELWDDVNLGIATAVPDGLVVPVIRQADQLGVADINENIRYLAKQARDGVLTREEVEGGTFTISNLGMFGIKSFTAIINPPQTGILAVGSTVRTPVVVDENDTIEVRPMMSMTLSVDHRVVDGAVGAQFLTDLVRVIENPDMIIY